MYICTKKTLTQLTDFLNRSPKFYKKTGKRFTVQDIQAYCRRRMLPKYMGDYHIEKDTNIKGVVLYNVVAGEEVDLESNILNYLPDQKLDK